MKALLIAVAFVAVVSLACTSDSAPSEQATASPTPRSEVAQQVSLTSAAPTPRACPTLAACPTSTACPADTACPSCPGMTCPQCPSCPTCPPCPSAPQCPQDTPCPAATPCQAGTPSLASDVCTSYKIGIEYNTILLEIAEQGELVGQTADEVRSLIQQAQQSFDQDCQGVALLEPTFATMACAAVAKWEGIQDTTVLWAPSAQDQVWADRFGSIVDRYCTP